MRIAIVGSGYVGLVTGTCFSDIGHEVICIDNDPAKIEALEQGEVPIYEPGLKEMIAKNVTAGRLAFSMDIKAGVKFAEVIFIAVNTPRMPSGEANLKYVEAVSREIAQHMNGYKVIVEKSTVPVNTSRKIFKTVSKYIKHGIEFDVVSNPEFLREGSALLDVSIPDRIVVGAGSDRARKIMAELYKEFKDKILFTDVNSAELIKHAANSFLAMKISYINAVAQVCELSGADVEEVARGIGLDSRIGTKFLRAGVGFGGSCFPKDVDAFERISRNLGYDFNLLREVQAINKLQRAQFIKKIKDQLWVVQDKKIAILGLAFKPDTDDIREAPAADIIKALGEEGGDIYAWDPQAVSKMRQLYPDVTYFEKDVYAPLQDADVCIIVTEWEDVCNLDLARVRELMKYPLIIDGRNAFTPAKMARAGFEYISIGRAPVKGK
ncbi:UDP-glucose dehydrogenase family protein [Planctomycetota bacterium]